MTLTHHRGPVQVPAPLTIASVPSGHVYVRHLAPMSGDAPHRLTDPTPSETGSAVTGQWWPPVMLDAAWAAQADFDVFHVHFGFDARSPEQLSDLVHTLRKRGKPLVYTVHDLRNPHQQDRAVHDAQLDVLVPAADALVTLTPGAAAEIEARWGRRAHVIPHPHVVGFPTMAIAAEVRRRSVERPFRVGLHVKSLRACMDPARLLPTLVATVADLDGAVLQVDAHCDVFDPSSTNHDAALASYLRDEERRGRLELAVHDYFSEKELWAYLTSLDVSVLPYRWGTHSGWLEACRDLQTTVVAPTCGFYADQGPVLSYVHDEGQFDPDSLRDAVTDAFTRQQRLGAGVLERSEQRQQVAAAHDELYRTVTA